MSVYKNIKNNAILSGIKAEDLQTSFLRCMLISMLLSGYDFFLHTVFTQTLLLQPAGDGHLTVWFFGEPSRGYSGYGGEDIAFHTSVASFTGMYKTTGISSIHGSGVTKVYPSPADKVLHVVADDAANYTITDLAGRKVIQGTLSRGDNTLNMDKLITGMYPLVSTILDTFL